MNEVLYYECPNVTTKLISTEEVKALYEMFDSLGWRIFKEMRKADAKYSAERALDLGSTPDQKARYTLAYHLYLHDVQLEKDLSEALSGQKAEKLENFEQPVVGDNGTIPLISRLKTFFHLDKKD